MPMHPLRCPAPAARACGPVRFRPRSFRGFNLIELMIVVAIIGTLGAIAFPSYQESVRKAHRSDAQAALTGMQAAMDRFFIQGNTYLGATGGAALPAAAAFYPAQVPLEGGTATYNLRVTALTAATYTLQAIPVGRQVGDKCGTYEVASTGAQNIRNQRTGVTVAECWRR